MKRFIQIFFVILTLMFMAGCSLKVKQRNHQAVAAAKTASDECTSPVSQSINFYLRSNDSNEKLDTVRVEAIGYGAPPKKYYPEYQRRLMAMRAAKIDAYRALAETINGLRIWGGTTLGDMSIKSDNYRVFLNSYVRGAKVEKVKERQDGNYEAYVSTIVDQSFLNYMLSNNLNHNSNCGSKINAAGINRGLSSVVYSDGAAPSSFYYSE